MSATNTPTPSDTPTLTTTPTPTPIPNGVVYEDDNPLIAYAGAWSHWVNTFASGNSLSSALDAGATASLTVHGVGDRLSRTADGVATNYVNDTAAGLTQVLSDGTDTYLYGLSRIAQQGTNWQYFGADGLGSARQLYNSSGQVSADLRYDP